MMNKITILGSGTSTGVPILGCNCHVCQSNDSRNKRFRTSVLLQTAKTKNILVDASPDLRTQLLSSNIMHLDSAIITHDHADHTHGMDDLRPYTFKNKNPIHIHTTEETKLTLEKKFPYIFQRHLHFADKPVLGGGIPLLDLVTIGPGHYSIVGESFEFYKVPHGHDDTLALRHSSMAYIVDCREIPSETLDKLTLAKLELLIIDCLRLEPHSTHLHLDLTLEYIHKINPRIAVLTHLGHEMEYLDLISQLERRGIKNVFPAIDGQSFLYS